MSVELNETRGMLHAAPESGRSMTYFLALRGVLSGAEMRESPTDCSLRVSLCDAGLEIR